MALPSPVTYGLELLPLLRWLVFHGKLRTAVLLEDGRGLVAPVLAHALPAEATLARITASGPIEPGVDLVQIAADLSPDALREVLGRLRPTMSGSGLIVLSGSGAAQPDPALCLPVADGVTLIPLTAPFEAFVWLARQSKPEQLKLAHMFDVFARHITAVAQLAGRAASRPAQEQRQHAAAELAAAKLQQARLSEALITADLARAESQLKAMRGSTSWRLTAPMRGLVLAAKRRRAWNGEVGDKRADATDLKIAFKKQAADALWDFLVSGERLRLPCHERPDVSILLVLFNQAALTLQCLRSIIDTTPPDASLEVVVVDNASTDDTRLLLERMQGVRVVYNADNRHFLHAANQAAGEARSNDLLFLNNDACLRPGALQAAHTTLHAAADVGATGAKIILIDGTLQEAGSIVWRDGTCLGYGRGKAPDAPPYQFRRDVDFCSGAFLLCRAELFRKLGGFNADYAPAYYEEVDLCLRMREAGYRVVYEPQAEILHYEFGSSGGSEQAFALQRRNHGLFAEQHASLLERQLPASTAPLFARMPSQRPRMLYIDDRVPYPELGAGYPRAARLLREMVARGWFVTVYPAHHPDDQWDAVYKAFPRDIEFMVGFGAPQLAEFLHARDDYYTAIMVSRPHNMRSFLAARNGTHKGVRLIYDAEAMFSSRELLRLQQRGTPANDDARRAMLREEINLTKTADVVTTVNEHEARIFRGGGHGDVRVLGLGVEPNPIPAGFAGRRDLLFVGALDTEGGPNCDALLWFVRTVMPLLDRRLGPGVQLLVAGRCTVPPILALASDRVHLLGLVDDLTPLYSAARIFVAPHRFAAGLPLKVQEAVGRGLPVVASELLARQLDWTDGHELLTAATADAFAVACARLYHDGELWHTLRRRALDRLKADIQTDQFSGKVDALLRDVQG